MGMGVAQSGQNCGVAEVHVGAAGTLRLDGGDVVAGNRDDSARQRRGVDGEHVACSQGPGSHGTVLIDRFTRNDKSVLGHCTSSNVSAVIVKTPNCSSTTPVATYGPSVRCVISL